MFRDRVFARILHPAARRVAEGDWSSCRFLLLVTFRRDGSGVPTPVWFAQEGRSLYMATDATSWKVKRVRRTPDVLVAPCDLRGRPLGPGIRGTARVLEASEADVAESALQARYGRARRVYRRLFPPTKSAYLEVIAG